MNVTGDERAQARNKSSKSGPFFDVLNNLFVRVVRFSITKRVDKHILSMNQLICCFYSL